MFTILWYIINVLYDILCQVISLHTFTDDQFFIIHETHGTFTAETAEHVDAHTIVTHTCNVPTLIDVCGSHACTHMKYACLIYLCVDVFVCGLLYQWLDQCRCQWRIQASYCHTALQTHLQQKTHITPLHCVCVCLCISQWWPWCTLIINVSKLCLFKIKVDLEWGYKIQYTNIYYIFYTIYKNHCVCVCLTGAGYRTLFAGFIPRSADVVWTAAGFLGHVGGEFSVTCGIISVVVSVTQALPHVYTHTKTNTWQSELKSELLCCVYTDPCSCFLRWSACTQMDKYRCSFQWCYNTDPDHRYQISHTRLHLKNTNKHNDFH